jgi:hypothetical protein
MYDSLKASRMPIVILLTYSRLRGFATRSRETNCLIDRHVRLKLSERLYYLLPAELHTPVATLNERKHRAFAPVPLSRTPDVAMRIPTDRYTCSGTSLELRFWS